MVKKFIFIFVAVAALFYFSNSAYALTIGPSRLEVSLSPGEIGVADYYVQNELDWPVHVLVEPENWHKDTYNYGTLPVEDWIKLDIYEFDLQPKEIKKLKLTVTVPTKVRGELAAQVFFSSSVTDEKGESSGIRARLGAIIYVAIKGTEKVDAEISGINISKSSENGKEKLKVTLSVRNKGNVHLRPTGRISIKNPKGETLAESDLVSGQAVLPDSQQEYSASMDAPCLENGKYTITGSINYGEIFKMKKEAVLKKSFICDEKGELVIK